MSKYKKLYKIINSRRSIRDYIKKDISDKVILKIIQAGLLAPSPTNRQPWKFFIVKSSNTIAEIISTISNKINLLVENIQDKDEKEDFKRYAENFYFFKDASFIIAIYYKNPPKVAGVYFNDEKILEKGTGNYLSCGMVAQNMLLIADTLNIGSCLMTGIFVIEEELKKIFMPPPRYNLSCLISFGYYNKKPKSPMKKNIEKIYKFIN